MGSIIIPHLSEVRISCRNNYLVTGVYTCSCGNKIFHIKTPNNKANDYSQFLTVFICNQCGQQHVIFDSIVLGYDAMMGNIPKRQVNYPLLIENHCRKCTSGLFTSVITYEYPLTLTDELEEFGVESFEYWKYFTWIKINLICNHCNKKIRNFVSLETG